MKKKLFFIATFALTSLLVSQAAFAESFKVSTPETDYSIESLYATRPSDARVEWTSEIHSYNTVRHTEEDLPCKLKITAEAKGAEIYVDGKAIGSSPVTVEVEPGRHQVKVKKSLWETREVTVRAVEDRDSYFFISMEYIGGRLNFVTTPSSAKVYIKNSSGSSTSCSGSSGTDLESGDYTLIYRCFGYKEMTRSVSVVAQKKRTVTASMDTVPFEYTSLSSDRKSFNPKNGGRFGKLNFTVGVTAPNTGIFEIISPDQDIIYSERLSYTDWYTSVTWNGKDKAGNYAGEGQYTARVRTDDLSIENYFTIDSSISIPHLNITADGSGLGPVASAQLFPSGTFQFSADVGYFPKTAATLDVGLLAACGNHVELTGTFGVDFRSSAEFRGSLALKAGGSWKSEQNTFWLAGTVNWGGTTRPYPMLYGVDLGYGLGGGVLFGVKRDNYYFGFESAFTKGPVTGDFIRGTDYAFKNGILFQYEGTTFTAGASAAVTTSKGTCQIYDDDGVLTKEEDITSPFRSAQAEGDITLFLGNSGWALNGKAGMYYLPETGKILPYANAGISVTF